MPVVQWDSVDKAGGVGSVWFQGDSAHGSLHMAAGATLFRTCYTRIPIVLTIVQFQG